MSGSIGKQPLPGIDIPMVTSEGRVTEPWHRLFQTLWQKTGASITTTQNFLFLQRTGSGVDVSSAADPNGSEGQLVFSGAPGAPEQVLSPGSSPFIYTAATAGTLLVDSGEVEIRRASGSWYAVSLSGGAVPLRAQDSARISWQGPAPIVVWMGD